MSELSGWLNKERMAWLTQRGAAGGTAALFRVHVVGMRNDPTIAIVKADWPRLFADGAAADSADRAWRSPHQESLFETDGEREPRIYTRTAKGAYGAALDDEEAYEQIAFDFATVSDKGSDANLRMRKAAQSTSAAYSRLKSYDESMRRAKGDDTKLVKDLTDDKFRKDAAE